MRVISDSSNDNFNSSCQPLQMWHINESVTSSSDNPVGQEQYNCIMRIGAGYIKGNLQNLLALLLDFLISDRLSATF